MPHDLKSFEGDWWFLVEEEELEHAPDQRITLADGVIVRQHADVGNYTVTDGRLRLIFDGSAPYETLMNVPEGGVSIDHLSGNIVEGESEDDGPFFTYCTMIRDTGDQPPTEDDVRQMIMDASARGATLL